MMLLEAISLRGGVTMTQITNRLFCHLDGLTPEIREEKKFNTIKKLGLLETETIPVFEEATQTVARFIEVPICILTLMVKQEVWLKSAFGLSRLGLMNPLATFRKIPKSESFCTYVVDSQQDLIIPNTLEDPFFATNSLVQDYGINAYLGTPLITGEGECIGTLAVIDLVNHNFTNKDIDFLMLSARWCLREFERDVLLKSSPPLPTINQELVTENLSSLKTSSSSLDSDNFSKNFNNTIEKPTSKITNKIQVKLIKLLTEELKTPLTSIIGMTSVLRQQVYGNLTPKQKEYLEIVYNSGQDMISLVDEIVNLGIANDLNPEVQLSPVDLEMLCQQIINNIDQFAKRQQLGIRLSVEPGNSMWLLDKEKTRQAIYYLIISTIESSPSGGEVRIHISRRDDSINIGVWISHPWLGDGLSSQKVELFSQEIENQENCYSHILESLLTTNSESHQPTSQQFEESHESISHNSYNQRELLGLLFSLNLAQMQGGTIKIQGSSAAGYRYLLKLPKIPAIES